MRGDAVAPHIGPSALWACGILGKVHGLRGELYLNLASGGLEHLRRGSEFYLGTEVGDAPEGAERLIPCAVTRVGGTDQRPLVLLDLAQTTRAGGLALQGARAVRRRRRARRAARTTASATSSACASRPSRAGSSARSATCSRRRPTRSSRSARRTAPSVLVPLVDELVAVDVEAGLARVVDGLSTSEAERSALRRLHPVPAGVRLVPLPGPRPQRRGARPRVPAHELPRPHAAQPPAGGRHALRRRRRDGAAHRRRVRRARGRLRRSTRSGVKDGRRVVELTPKGRQLDDALAAELAARRPRPALRPLRGHRRARHAPRHRPCLDRSLRAQRRRGGGHGRARRRHAQAARRRQQPGERRRANRTRRSSRVAPSTRTTRVRRSSAAGPSPRCCSAATTARSSAGARGRWERGKTSALRSARRVALCAAARLLLH